jgi:hypothetical protein
MAYPATVAFDAPERLANWRPLVQWIMAIPHIVLAYILGIVSGAIALVSWFIVVFTGRLPEGIADLQAMTLRYIMRARVYVAFLHSEYPPFDFTASSPDPGGQPIRLDFIPQTENRNRLTVGLRIIWMIPAMFYAFVIGIIAVIMWFLAFFAVLFMGRWPAMMLDRVMRSVRVNTRFGAYLFLLTDKYPPFETD